MIIDRILLEKQFTKSQIKQRKGNFGTMIDYIPTQLVIQRLNDAFDSLWNFKVIEHQILENEVIILGELYAAGVSKQQFGSNKISKSKQGETISIGDDLKSATSDSLKKCASMMGIALHIYGDGLPEQKTEIINTANDHVELPVDEEQQNQECEHTDAVDVYADSRKAYFASKLIKSKTDEERYQWNLKYIKKVSCKDWNLKDWKKALELIRLQKDPMEFTDPATGNPLPPTVENQKKELPHFDAGLRDNNGGARQASKAQIQFVNKLLDKKGYYTKEEVQSWTLGKASTIIDFLNLK